MSLFVWLLLLNIKFMIDCSVLLYLVHSHCCVTVPPFIHLFCLSLILNSVQFAYSVLLVLDVQ